MSEKTHWKKFHNPDYLGAYAFQPGERKILTISKAVQEVVTGQGNRKEDCLVVHFQEGEKPLICNVTNSKAITKVAGSPFIEDWPNVKIELYTEKVNAFGDMVDAVRVKRSAPIVTKPNLTNIEGAAQAVAAGTATRESIETHYTVTDDIWAQVEARAEGITLSTNSGDAAQN